MSRICEIGRPGFETLPSSEIFIPRLNIKVSSLGLDHGNTGEPFPDKKAAELEAARGEFDVMVFDSLGPIWMEKMLQKDFLKQDPNLDDFSEWGFRYACNHHLLIIGADPDPINHLKPFYDKSDGTWLGEQLYLDEIEQTNQKIENQVNAENKKTNSLKLGGGVIMLAAGIGFGLSKTPVSRRRLLGIFAGVTTGMIAEAAGFNNEAGISAKRLAIEHGLFEPLGYDPISARSDPTGAAHDRILKDRSALQDLIQKALRGEQITAIDCNNPAFDRTEKVLSYLYLTLTWRNAAIAETLSVDQIPLLDHSKTINLGIFMGDAHEAIEENKRITYFLEHPKERREALKELLLKAVQEDIYGDIDETAKLSDLKKWLKDPRIVYQILPDGNVNEFPFGVPYLTEVADSL